MNAISILQSSWLVVKDWHVESRYESNVPENLAKDMHSSCAASLQAAKPHDVPHLIDGGGIFSWRRFFAGQCRILERTGVMLNESPATNQDSHPSISIAPRDRYRQIGSSSDRSRRRKTQHSSCDQCRQETSEGIGVSKDFEILLDFRFGIRHP